MLGIAPNLAAFSRRHAALIGALLFLIALAAFLYDLSAPEDVYFDETWYVPAARAWLANGENLHPEHPPLAKALIGVGLMLFGDNPFGWRAMSALFGALTILATYLWSLTLVEDIAAATWVALITGFNQVLYVQSRIAMLDVFLFAFITFGLAAFTYAVKTESRGRGGWALAAMGVCFGLAGACKISGFFTLFGLIGLCLLIIGAKARSRREPGRGNYGAAPALTPLTALLGFVIAPLAAYMAAYAPQAIRHGSWLFLIQSQREMFSIMLGHSATHPYASLWYSWPWEWRPVWYLFDVEGGDTSKWSDDNPAAAVVALANPLVLLAGQAAVVFAAWRALTRFDREGSIVAVAAFAQWLPWIVNPKGLEFNYYYFPTILTFGPALALIWLRPRRLRGDLVASLFLLLAAAMFVFFLPVLSADIGVVPDDLDARAWLSTWR